MFENDEMLKMRHVLQAAMGLFEIAQPTVFTVSIARAPKTGKSQQQHQQQHQQQGRRHSTL
jgi:hypothetical protein